MDRWNGWMGIILNVNLTKREITKEPLNKEWAIKYIGGSGLGARILYDEVEPGTDSLDADNVIVVGQGPLSGTAAPASGRCVLVTKSPQTGIYLRTNLGGFFGPEMKQSGYDLIVIRGKSENPVYLWVNNDLVELRDASHIWGKDIFEGRQMICNEIGDPNIHTLQIGPAGENLCLCSCVIGDTGRAAGKGSAGAVWGSKNLRAIACRGTKSINIARPSNFEELCSKLTERIKQDPMYETQAKYGTLRWVADPFVKQAIRRGDDLPGLLTEEIFNPWGKLIDKSSACFNCPIQCSHGNTIKEGKYKGSSGHGPEAHAIVFGAIQTRIGSPSFACHYSNVCNKLGLNTDSTGLAIGWATQLYNDGIITKEDTDGLELNWCDEEVFLKLVNKIAYREGFGDLLDKYPVEAAERLGRGSDQYIYETKGMPWVSPGVDVSCEWTLGLHVATRGMDHLIGAPATTTFGLVEEMTPELIAKLSEERYGDPKVFGESWTNTPKKAQYVFDRENVMALCDMTGICKFASEQSSYVTGWHLEDFVNLVSAATGVDYTVQDMVRAGERQMLLERAFNAREGIRRIDDYPIVFRWQLKYNEPHPRLKHKRFHMDMEGYSKLLDEYYKIRGCDLKTGIPTGQKLEQVSLKDVARDLEKYVDMHSVNNPATRGQFGS